MRAPIKIDMQDFQGVVDTGAEVTVINKNIFDQLPEKDRPVIKLTDRALVVAEKDRKLGSHGMVTVTFNINNKQYKWPMYIANIHDDILLGADFLDHHDINVNLRRGLFIGNTWVKCITE